MANIRSANEIIQSLLDFFRLTSPELDTKSGTVARDLFVESPASQLSLLYDELGSVSNQQSLRLVVGSDLDKLGKNFGVTRKQSTAASGTAIITFASLAANVSINKGDTVTSSTGITYTVLYGTTILASSANFYKSIATKFRDQLDTAGISDQYAVQVTVSATSPGTAGNIGTYSLSRTNIVGASNVTNIAAFAGGTNQESDVDFRNRILASFSGSSVGTALGYLNVALGTSGVSDSYVVTPGDPLMTRDGSIVTINSDFSRTVVSEGSGGKVDVIVLGTNLIENKDSYIYQDKSNNNDPTSSKNDVVLGQIAADANKTINRKRIDDLKNGVLPAQPVREIIEVTGSLSGSNFVEKSTDENGIVSGNFELVKDTGSYGGSPWGFDTFKWISNKVSLFSEDRIKGQFNGQDTVAFTDVLNIPKIQQNISITNENSIVTSDRSVIQLLHTPATNVTRVFNINTGERYIITNQNFDNTGTYNTSGRIQISGNTLPAVSDQLQVDYSWVVYYDPNSDYDGLLNTNNPREITDSIDWGYGSVVENELITFIKDPINNFFIGTSLTPITSILSAKTFDEIDGYVSQITTGLFAGRYFVKLDNLKTATTSIDFIKLKNNISEIYKTAQNDGSFTSVATVFGTEIRYNTTIILPTDTAGISDDLVTVKLNSQNVFQSSTLNGSSSGTQITIPADLILTSAAIITLMVTYISSVADMAAVATTSLPMSRVSNGLLLSNNSGFVNFSITNLYRREHQTIQKNTSDDLYVELNVLATDYSIAPEKVVSIIRLSDYAEVWNSDNAGVVIIGNSGNYQLVFNGINSPAVGDKVLIVYFAADLRRFQPTIFSNKIIKSRVSSLQIDPSTNKYFIPINSFTTQSSNVKYFVIEPNTDIEIFGADDGSIINNGATAQFTSVSINFATIPDIKNKKLVIYEATDPFNSGVYDIVAYNSLTNELTITCSCKHITNDQISIIRIHDGKEVWNYSGLIDVANNKLLLPSNAQINLTDKVYCIIYNFDVVKQSPTRIINTISDQVINNGVITIAGTTLYKADNIVFTATSSGLRQNMLEAFRKALGINSSAPIPTNIKLVKIVSMDKVVTLSAGNDTIISTLITYDTDKSFIANNLLYPNDMLRDETLSQFEFILPNTLNNVSTTNSVKNIPSIGDKLRITFYYVVENDSENLSYSRNGILYTNKKFALINKVYISSGFKSSQSTRMTSSFFTQPGLGSRYKVFYDYLAPKQNERIVIRYNYNKIISDVTFNIENTRPINADVIVKEASQVGVDLTMNVVILDSYQSSKDTILQNLRNQLITTMTTNTLGQTIDTTTLINVAQSITGIARARVIYFNRTGQAGQVLIVQAQLNEYLVPNTILLDTETR